MYSIKAITSITGLTAETLRAWERRYACIEPNRNENGRRSYSQADLEKLKLLVDLTRSGHAISKIANLTCEQLRHFQNQSPEQNDQQQTNLFNQLIEALRHYRIERCEQLLKRAQLAYEPLEYARDILLPALHLIGQLWHEEKINIAQEHMFSNCVKRIVLTMVNNLHQPSRQNPSMLFATPSGEPHEFGILLGCLVAAAQQYTCYYVGPDLPSKDIIDASRHLKPTVIVMGMVKNPPELQTLVQVDQLLHFAETSATAIWLAGAGAQHWLGLHKSPPPGCELISDIDQFHTKARQRQFLR
ncbi:MerR family transcriptional regulator [Methylomonas sp. SURF-2]|uniref:MerR family transcriptional regulator n=1 Tax=Methylomonas subterranea TaxID=2952225 RepID=A0ABT1TB46_9GAMM|nr:MerR family transcriptional regulator [Methylomonas sp. SURF-2]MCQ8102688.1 MerR family transcriptional regulator [Methylomonas sp. SURF-2]